MSDLAIDWSIELTMQWGDGHTFPFVEDENANITGYGHRDRDWFAAQVNRYDAVCNGGPFPESEQWTADYIDHKWAVPDHDPNGEWILRPCALGTPGAVPITTLWGQR